MQWNAVRARSRTPHRALLSLALLVTIPVGAAWGQEETEEKKTPRPPTIFDFGHQVDDPSTLLSPKQDLEDRWRRIWRQTGTRYHLYPTQKAGRDNRPPLGMYAGGWNYSVWRDPVTGWPEF